MGENQSKQGQTGEQRGCQEMFILDDPQKISLKDITGNIYFWIDRKVSSPQSTKFLEFLKGSFEVRAFSSVEKLDKALCDTDPGKKVKIICCENLNEEDYQKLQADPRITDIFLFSLNKKQIKPLMMNYSKIKVARSTIQDLKEAISEGEVEDKKHDRKSNILFMIEDHIHRINKYRLNYHCLTCYHSLQSAKQDFIKLARNIYKNQQEQIKKFQEQYNPSLETARRGDIILEWALQDSFFWSSTQDLPKITTNPKKLGYLRLPFKQIISAINQKYKNLQKASHEFYIVIQLSKQEVEKLKENVDNFFTFTSFVKGFTKEKQADKQKKKSKKKFLFRVQIPNSLKMDKQFDFGYWFSTKRQGLNVIFNIYNFFSIDEVDIEEREATIKYGALADVSYRREKQREEAKLTPQESNLIRNCDYIENMRSSMDTQASLLQMSGYFQESVKLQDQKIEFIRTTQPSQAIDKEIIELGDAFRLNENYKEAEKQYKKVTKGFMETIALVHLAEMYYRLREEEKLKPLIPQIERGAEVLRVKNPTEYFKARNFIGVSMMNKGKTKEAHKIFDDLLQKVTLHYSYKHEGIPLVHDIYRNMANCKSQLNQFKDALNLLNSTKSWQKGCEGSRSPNLVVTESLIRSVYHSKGDLNNMRESEAQLAKLNSTVDSQEQVFLKRSNISVQVISQSSMNIEQSNVAINL